MLKSPVNMLNVVVFPAPNNKGRFTFLCETRNSQESFYSNSFLRVNKYKNATASYHLFLAGQSILHEEFPDTNDQQQWLVYLHTPEHGINY